MKSLGPQIRGELHGFPREKVAAFIRDVESAVRSHHPDFWQFTREERTRLQLSIKRTESFQRHLNRLPCVSAFPQDLNALLTTPASDANREADLKLYAMRDRQVRELSQLREAMIAAEQRMSAAQLGRRKADPHGLLTVVAHAYAARLDEEPKSTYGGHFHNLAVHILNQKNVTRPVLAAIRAYKNSR